MLIKYHCVNCFFDRTDFLFYGLFADDVLADANAWYF